MKLNPQQLKTIHDYFATQPVLRAFLFGSYARGEADPDSDVDLLVELDYERMNGGLQFIQMQLELQALLNRKVDLVSTQGLAASLAPQINSDKMEVYAREIQ